MNWKIFISQKKRRIELIVTVVLLTVVLISLTNFLNYVEIREGVVLNDPVLNLFEPVDVTWISFVLIYSSLITAVIYLINKPERLLFAVQLYIVLVIIRMASMFLVPFEPPADMIPLKDPFVEFFGTGKMLTKDLFFSGHTATLFMLFLVIDNKKLKYIFLAFTILVAFCVLLQHVHYALDVFAAPFFTYAAYRILKIVRTKIHLT